MLASYSGGLDLSVTVLGDFEGTYKLCAKYGATWSTLAALVLLETRVCVFQADDNPCTAEVCLRDQAGEMCQLFVAEYCTTHPEDPGCARVVPIFARRVGETTTMRIHTRGTKNIRVLPEGCGPA